VNERWNTKVLAQMWPRDHQQCGLHQDRTGRGGLNGHFEIIHLFHAGPDFSLRPPSWHQTPTCAAVMRRYEGRIWPFQRRQAGPGSMRYPGSDRSGPAGGPHHRPKIWEWHMSRVLNPPPTLCSWGQGFSTRGSCLTVRLAKKPKGQPLHGAPRKTATWPVLSCEAPAVIRRQKEEEPPTYWSERLSAAIAKPRRGTQRGPSSRCFGRSILVSSLGISLADDDAHSSTWGPITHQNTFHPDDLKRNTSPNWRPSGYTVPPHPSRRENKDGVTAIFRIFLYLGWTSYPSENGANLGHCRDLLTVLGEA